MVGGVEGLTSALLEGADMLVAVLREKIWVHGRDLLAAISSLVWCR